MAVLPGPNRRRLARFVRTFGAWDRGYGTTQLAVAGETHVAPFWFVRHFHNQYGWLAVAPSCRQVRDS